MNNSVKTWIIRELIKKTNVSLAFLHHSCKFLHHSYNEREILL